MATRYNFRTATGATCCQADSFDLLCAACKQRDTVERRYLGDRSSSGLLSALTVAAESIPPPPSLVDAIRRAGERSRSTSSPRGRSSDAISVLRPVPPPEALRSAGAPAPAERFPVTVSLVDNIRASAATRRTNA